MTAAPITAAQRREVFRCAVTDGCASSHLLAMRLAAFVGKPLGRLVVGLMAALVAGMGVSGVALAADEEGGCESESANTLLNFVDFIAEFLIGIGAAASLLLFAVGGCFIIFGGTPQRVNKGYELIRQTVVGLAVLASGAFVKTVIVGFVFNRKAEALQYDC